MYCNVREIDLPGKGLALTIFVCPSTILPSSDSVFPKESKILFPAKFTFNDFVMPTLMKLFTITTPGMMS